MNSQLISKTNRLAFTLIELMVAVVVLLAVMVAVGRIFRQLVTSLLQARQLQKHCSKALLLSNSYVKILQIFRAKVSLASILLQFQIM